MQLVMEKWCQPTFFQLILKNIKMVEWGGIKEINITLE